jgi:hypothetical protein
MFTQVFQSREVQRTGWQVIVGARHLEGIRMYQSRKSRTVNPKTKSALHLANPGMLNLEAKKRRVQCTKNINFLP